MRRFFSLTQDLDECQVDWIEHQLKFYTHIYCVGDAAQTIFSFRGARSKFVTNIPNAIDRSLTTSWRFGPVIANVANTVLFAKHYSPQTCQYKKLWIPYRLKGNEKIVCTVTSQSMLPQWKNHPVTVIASGNATLMIKAMDLLGMGDLLGGTEESDEDEGEPGGDESAFAVKARIVTPDDTFDVPKIHINGKGESSGLRKWHGVAKQISTL